MNTKTINENNNSGIPAILSGQALNSFRDSGYSLSDALGEVIDNSLDAKANNIYVQLDQSQKKSKSKKTHISSMEELRLWLTRPNYFLTIHCF